MHARGWVHRYVTPKHLMSGPDGIVKLIGMSIARRLDDRVSAMAEAGRALGSPRYMSPEQIRGEIRIDPRADIYGLGCTLYRMITGRLPFEGSTPAAIMHKHLKEPVVPPDHVVPSLSPEIGELVERMMAKNPEDRPQSMAEVISQCSELVSLRG
jgi:serine/threonine-protein kinase